MSAARTRLGPLTAAAATTTTLLLVLLHADANHFLREPSAFSSANGGDGGDESERVQRAAPPSWQATLHERAQTFGQSESERSFVERSVRRLRALAVDDESPPPSDKLDADDAEIARWSRQRLRDSPTKTRRRRSGEDGRHYEGMQMSAVVVRSSSRHISGDIVLTGEVCEKRCKKIKHIY